MLVWDRQTFHSCLGSCAGWMFLLAIARWRSSGCHFVKARNTSRGSSDRFSFSNSLWLRRGAAQETRRRGRKQQDEAGKRARERRAAESAPVPDTTADDVNQQTSDAEDFEQRSSLYKTLLHKKASLAESLAHFRKPGPSSAHLPGVCCHLYEGHLWHRRGHKPPEECSNKIIQIIIYFYRALRFPGLWSFSRCIDAKTDTNLKHSPPSPRVGLRSDWEPAGRHVWPDRWAQRGNRAGHQRHEHGRSALSDTCQKNVCFCFLAKSVKFLCYSDNSLGFILFFALFSLCRTTTRLLELHQHCSGVGHLWKTLGAFAALIKAAIQMNSWAVSAN